MSENEKISFSDAEVVELMSRITFNLGAVIMEMRDALGMYKDFPERKDKNEKRILENLKRSAKAIEKLQENIKLLSGKTNYNGVEELLKLEREMIDALSPLIERIRQSPFAYAAAWGTGSENDLSSSFKQNVTPLEDKFQSLNLFTRYGKLIRMHGGRKLNELKI